MRTRAFVFCFCLTALPAMIAQCTDSTTWVLGHVTTTRLNGNHVTGYADTTVIGNYRYSWYVYVQSWMYLDTFPSEIGSYGTSARQALGAPTNPQNYDATLSYWGTGTYKVRGYHTAYTPFCNIYEPPYANGWSGWSTSNLTTVVRPTITRGVIPYFLGTGVTQSNDYSSQTALTIVNRNGAPETPTWSFVTGSTFGTLSCSNCVSATFMATMPGRFCTGYDVVLKASFNGFDSDWLWIDIQTPNLLEFVRVDEGTPAGGGWESHVDYRVRDGCNISMTNVTANEVFTTWQNFNGSNWDAPLKAAG